MIVTGGVDEPGVRVAVAADEAAVHALAAETATTFTVDRDAFRRVFASLLVDGDAHLLVVDVDGDVGGYLLGSVHQAFFANGPVAWIEELAVRTDLRRRGLGAGLVREFERRCGAGLVALATRRADEFYTALGYEASATYFRRLLQAPAPRSTRNGPGSATFSVSSTEATVRHGLTDGSPGR